MMNKTFVGSGDCSAAEKIEIPVLLYHVVSPNPDMSNQYQFSLPEFKKQMDYLHANGYSTVSVEEFDRILHKTAPMPEKPVLLTFDDCTIDFYTNVYPILKQYGMKAIQFTVSNWVDTPGHMTSSQLKTISENGIDVENHTEDHCFLTHFSHDQKLQNLQKTAEKITAMVGKAPDYFAYPYGDYDADAISVIKELGLKAAFIVEDAFSTDTTDMYALPRILISNGDSLTIFIKKLTQ